ncbi:MAG: YeeE/YedE thiosulfate transporter family protein [Myxococcales bacterium]|nr:YeeE/YedE thiosulfate transporter family protein [Myxococcales bacterium]
MTYWAWWLSALALASVPIAHWLLLNRTLAVSGRYTALVDRIRYGAPETLEGVDQAALIAALRAETEAALGPEAFDELDELDEVEAALPIRAPDGPLMHLLFLGGLAVGGLLSMLAAGSLHFSTSLRGEHFAALLSQLPLPMPLWLVLGGVFVGFGTRMAAGCTSGHGLCGVSQFQPGSLVATAAFFVAGIATSFALSVLP